MTSDALVSLNGSAQTSHSQDQRLSTLRAEATKLVDEVAGPLKHVALRNGDCAVELTWADPTPAAAVAPTGAVVAADTAAGHADLFTVVAPLVGVFYAAPSPGAPPFVRPGDRISADQQVGIIEAMKLMNQIATDVAGVVTDVLVTDGQPVEFGQELVRVRLDPETGA